MECDILWRKEFDHPENDYRDYRELWLRMCKNISQSGKPVALFGSAIPSQYEDCIERRYFSEIYYLALICDDDLLKERLKNRPSWRNCGSDEFIEGHIQFNNWFIQNAEKSIPPITLLDTSHDSTKTSVEKVIKWISERLR
jgi:gluconate kinase